jgi:UDPglucose--hexose-1-phosphate uridylyltransferase
MPNDTPELCIDPITGAEVLYAPQRAKRINALVREPLILPNSDFCPFCPGNEEETPAEVYRWPTSPDVSWQLRIVPNRFPAVATQLFSDSPAYGRHEVLIESARHEDDWLSLSVEHLAHVFEAIAARLRHWSTDPRAHYIQVFKNVGSRAGATLGHPHLQLVSLNYRPERILKEMHHVQEKCPALLEYKNLVVQRDDNYVTLCPPVSRVPYELWLLPQQQTAFDALSFDDYVKLAQHLQVSLHQLEAVIGKVAHNVIWKLPPTAHAHLPWRIEVLPRLTTFAGLELGSGLYVNPIRPELAAAQLTNALLPS